MNLYGDIFQRLPLGLLVFDRDGQIEEANRQAREWLGSCPLQAAAGPLSELARDRAWHPLDASDATGQAGGRPWPRIELGGRALEVSGIPLGGDGDSRQRTLVVIVEAADGPRRPEPGRSGEDVASLGRFSEEIAHEMRNPLGTIQLLACLLRKELKRPQDIDRVNQLLDTVDLMERRISGLVRLGKAAPIQVGLVNLHEILRDILKVPGGIAGAEASFVSVGYGDAEPLVECDPELMRPLLVSVILNALRSLPESSRLEIVTRRAVESEAIEIAFLERAEGGGNIVDRLSGSVGRTWGAGLAHLHNMLDLFRGEIRLERVADRGVSLVLSFPLAQMRRPAAEPASLPIPEDRVR